MKRILHCIALLFAAPAMAQQPELKTVPYVDLNRYLGKWYDIASFPQRFQKGCSCTTAEYSLNKDGSVTVVNRCLKEGAEKVSKGKAKVVDKTSQAKLSVSFFWPFKGKYWIIDLADDYSYAVVGHPSRDYLWILSRTPRMDEAVLKAIQERLKAKGYDLSRLQRTNQDCNTK